MEKPYLGVMLEDVSLLGTQLKLKQGDLVMCTIATNVPNNHCRKWYVSHIMWDNNDSILVYRCSFILLATWSCPKCREFMIGKRVSRLDSCPHCDYSNDEPQVNLRNEDGPEQTEQ